MIPNVPDWEHGEVYTMVYDSQCSGGDAPLPRNSGNHIPRAVPRLKNKLVGLFFNLPATFPEKFIKASSFEFEPAL